MATLLDALERDSINQSISVFSFFLEYEMMVKVYKPSNS